MTTALEWALVPALFTAACYAAAWYNTRPSEDKHDGIGFVADGIVALVVYLLATVLSLISWLLWVLLT